MALFTRVRAFLQRRRVARELDDELAFHIEMETDANVSRGLPPDEARRQALADFGDVTRTREAVLGVRSLALDSLWQDLRSAARGLNGARGFTFAAAGMLALAIGIVTAMFTIVDALVLRPVPFRDAEQLAQVRMNPDWGGPSQGLTPAVLQAWQESPAFDSVEWARSETALLEAGDTVIARGMATVTPGIFGLLGGVRPLHGRLFDASDGEAGRRDQIIVSETLWRSQFGGDPALVGQPITVDDERLTVVGILPAAFRFPASDTVLWRPVDPAGAPDELISAYARFARGIPRQDAERLATEAARQANAENAERRLWVSPLASGLRDEYSSRAIVLLAGGVLLVFLVLCGNVCGLLLARLTARRGEFGVRAVFGAARGRLMRQAFVESGVLGVIGAAAGAGIAWVLVSVAEALIPPSLLTQTLNPLHLDGRALAATSIAALAATLATGLVPAWLGTRVDIAGSLRRLDPGGTKAPGARALGRGLLVAEVALACMLLVCATLLARSFVNLTSADRGLDTTGITTLWLSLTAIDSEDTALREAIARSLEDELRAIPGVQQVAWSYGLPPRGGTTNVGDWVSDVPGASPMRLRPEHYRVSPEFFALYGIPIIRGRNLVPSDQYTDVIVSERLAQALWQGADPIGRTYRFAREYYRIDEGGPRAELGDEQIYRVVGLAREIRFPAVSDPLGFDADVPQLYSLYTPAPTPMISLRCEPACDIAVIRHRLASTHPIVSVQRARPAEADYAAALVRPRAAATLALAFAVVALLAAATGLFSVLSYTVNRRRREFGIRVALGASPAQIRSIVFRDGLAVTIAGLVLGSLLAALLARVLSALQYGVTAGDPISIAIVVGMIGLTAIAAMWRPAQMAGHIEPARLLRQE
jgi:putative ABC transport system permease protein